MNRYFIWLAYKGTNYCGWQRQPNGLSVQQCVEDVLETVLRRPVPLTGAGRTDAGVHARRMAAHFDVPKALDDTERLAGKLNRMLPQDIAIAPCRAVISISCPKRKTLLITKPFVACHCAVWISGR